MKKKEVFNLINHIILSLVHGYKNYFMLMKYFVKFQMSVNGEEKPGAEEGTKPVEEAPPPATEETKPEEKKEEPKEEKKEATTEKKEENGEEKKPEENGSDKKSGGFKDRYVFNFSSINQK